MSFLHRVSGLSRRDRVRSSDIQDRLSVGSIALIRASWGCLGIWSGHLLDVPLMGVSGMPIQVESPGQTKDTLERLYLSAGLGRHSVFPGGSSWGEEGLDFPAQVVAPVSRTKISSRKRKETKHTSHTHHMDISTASWVSGETIIVLLGFCLQGIFKKSSIFKNWTLTHKC